jgi:hypothetical protein
MVIAEAAYLTDRQLGPHAEAALYSSIISGQLEVAGLDLQDWERIRELVTGYADAARRDRHVGDHAGRAARRHPDRHPQPPPLPGRPAPPRRRVRAAALTTPRVGCWPHAPRRRLAAFLSAATAAVLAVVLPLSPASATAGLAAGTRAGASHPAAILNAGLSARSHGSYLRTPGGVGVSVLGGHAPTDAAGLTWGISVPGDHDFYIRAAATAVLGLPSEPLATFPPTRRTNAGKAAGKTSVSRQPLIQ